MNVKGKGSEYELLGLNDRHFIKYDATIYVS